MTGLNWDDVRVLLALARGGSLSASARALGVDHSTVARRVAALESELGVRLFDRLPRGYVPTAEGEDIAELAGRVEDAVAAGPSRCAAVGAGARGDGRGDRHHERRTGFDRRLSAVGRSFQSVVCRTPA